MSNFVDTTAENVRFVIKRNGEKVSFELSKMKSAITKAMESIDKVDEEMVEKIAIVVKYLFIEIQIISLM